MSKPKRATRTDATVTDADGLTWTQEMLREPPRQLLDRFESLEPTVLRLAARVACGMRETLIAEGTTSRLADYVHDKTLLTSVICAELIRRGHAHLWAELIEPEPPTGDNE